MPPEPRASGMESPASLQSQWDGQPSQPQKGITSSKLFAVRAPRAQSQAIAKSQALAGLQAPGSRLRNGPPCPKPGARAQRSQRSRRRDRKHARSGTRSEAPGPGVRAPCLDFGRAPPWVLRLCPAAPALACHLPPPSPPGHTPTSEEPAFTLR